MNKCDDDGVCSIIVFINNFFDEGVCGISAHHKRRSTYFSPITRNFSALCKINKSLYVLVELVSNLLSLLQECNILSRIKIGFAFRQKKI